MKHNIYKCVLLCASIPITSNTGSRQLMIKIGSDSLVITQSGRNLVYSIITEYYEY